GSIPNPTSPAANRRASSYSSPKVSLSGLVRLSITTAVPEDLRTALFTASEIVLADSELAASVVSMSVARILLWAPRRPTPLQLRDAEATGGPRYLAVVRMP